LKIAEAYKKIPEVGAECFVVDVIDSLKVGAPAISRHIKELENSGPIYTNKKEKFLVCRGNEEIFKVVNNILTLQ